MELFKNKLFLMIFASLFAICLFNSKCFATYSSTVDGNNIIVTNGEGYTHTVILSDAQMAFPYKCLFITYEPNVFCQVSLVLSNSSFYLKVDGGILSRCYFEDSSNPVYRYDFTGGGASRSSTDFSSISLNSFETVSRGSGSTAWDYSVFSGYSSVDIYDSDNNVLFQGASQPVEETNQVVLAEIVEPMEMDKTLAEILGILPIVIVVIVSLIAIRKAIAFLRTLLHRS